tara:strand:- start:493 stop:630 length:138 start_codon:yes stop_codon:yes gene_type:complete
MRHNGSTSTWMAMVCVLLVAIVVLHFMYQMRHILPAVSNTSRFGE